MTAPARLGDNAGFTLVEMLIAIVVLAGGFLALAQVFTIGLLGLAMAPYEITAREKATEAVESVYTARDTRTVTWDELRNAADGGIFLDGPQPLGTAGGDGLVNTADDGEVETIVRPGPDRELGSEDDLTEPLTQFTREVAITDVSANLRRIRITVRYRVGDGEREYTIETLISAFA